MRKVVKRTGNSLCIIFNVEDREAYGIEEGTIIEFVPTFIDNGDKEE